MCGIAAILQLKSEPVGDLEHRLRVMNHLQAHRGPDGEGLWRHDHRHVGFGHRRLAVIDLETGDQPMSDAGGNWVVFNGEIYNYIELRSELGEDSFRTTSDTEVILHAYRRWGRDCVNHFSGMFAFALWDESELALFCARDHFGIKPFYYAAVDQVLYCASEAKALLPFLPTVATDLEGIKDYLAFQFCLSGKTLFEGVRELEPGHHLTVKNGQITKYRYWQVYYDLDWDHADDYFQEQICDRLQQSVALQLRADVPVGAHVSGGYDSSLIASLAAEGACEPLAGFTGKFTIGDDYDESRFARELASQRGVELHEIDIGVGDFIANIEDVIYHLDFPVAGPGSFAQYMVSGLAARHRKVVLGGQGGDEIFGGYARYLIAYFEQCIKAAIDGTMHRGNFVVTYESILPNLSALRKYKPLLQEFWREGLFEELDKRYFRLIDRAPLLGDEIRWDALGDYSPYDTFRGIFYGDNVERESYFDLMTHFDFKTLLPALLHVEDRVSMAHGLESRVPFLDRPLVELAATIPPKIKFAGGELKRILRKATRHHVPDSIADRTDKMGFPVPIVQWFAGEANDFVRDILTSQAASQRELVDNRVVSNELASERQFGRKVWGLFCLEIWQRRFHDRQQTFQRLRQELPE